MCLGIFDPTVLAGQPLPQQNVLGGEAFCSVATARFLSLRQERGGGGSAPWEQTGSCLNPEVVFLDFVGFFFFSFFYHAMET